MVKGIILFVIAILLLWYAVGCWTPGQGSKKEEQEDG